MMAIPIITAGDIDLMAAKLQLAELQQEVLKARDAQLALQLFLEDAGGAQVDASAVSVSSAGGFELELLQEQMANLSAVISTAEDSQAALGLVDAEEAQQAASLQAASALQAQEQWDATVLRPHDEALARTIAACDEWEWQERGEWIEQPLDISSRPQQPEGCTCTGSSCSTSTTPPLCQQHQQLQGACAPGRAAGGTAAGPGSSASNPGSSAAAQRYRHSVASSSSHHHLGGASSSRYDGASSSKHYASSSSSHYAGASSSSHYAGASSSSQYSDASRSSHYAGASSSSQCAQASVQCAICFDLFAAGSMLSAHQAPDDVASSSSCTGRCPHLFCRSCMRGYVHCEVQSRKYPIYCPDPSCRLELGVDDIMLLLQDNQQDLQLFEYLIAEHLIDTARRVYCPYKDCSVLLERPEPDEEMVDAAGNQEAPYECPCCKRHFCLHCGITGWHTGLTCKDFQALPPEQRSAEDAAVHHIARSKMWKRCPARGCGHMVERIEGCNHMHCICGCSFCYACGAQYQGTQPTADNVHGTPSCNCELFAVPEEDPEQQEQQQAPMPVVLHQANARRPKPWRNGRFVSRTRCRFSDSIYDCPRGPSKCWFWHDEDDE